LGVERLCGVDVGYAAFEKSSSLHSTRSVMYRQGCVSQHVHPSARHTSRRNSLSGNAAPAESCLEAAVAAADSAAAAAAAADEQASWAAGAMVQWVGGDMERI
jgi:hypothetical protein